MGMLPNTDDVELKEGSFEPLPKGNYRAIIFETKQFESKNGDPMVKISLEITEGQYSGRKMFDNIFLHHADAVTLRIAKERLKQIKNAIGKPDARTDEEFWGGDVMIYVGFQKNDPERNEVKSYKPVKGAAPAAPKPAASRATATAPVHTSGASGARSPWRK